MWANSMAGERADATLLYAAWQKMADDQYVIIYIHLVYIYIRVCSPSSKQHKTTTHINAGKNGEFLFETLLLEPKANTVIVTV